MEVARATQSWDALHMLPFADMKIRNLTVLRNAGRSIIGHAYSRVTERGVHLAIARRELAEPSDAPKPWKCEFSGVGAFLDAHQDTAICFLEELPDACSASPSFRHFCARPPWCIPRRFDNALRNRAWDGERVRKSRYGVASPCRNAAQMELRPTPHHHRWRARWRMGSVRLIWRPNVPFGGPPRRARRKYYGGTGAFRGRRDGRPRPCGSEPLSPSGHRPNRRGGRPRSRAPRRPHNGGRSPVSRRFQRPGMPLRSQGGSRDGSRIRGRGPHGSPRSLRGDCQSVGTTIANRGFHR